MKRSISCNIWQPYTSAHGLKNYIRPGMAEAHHWMKTLIVILYAVKFSQTNMERKSAHTGH